MEGESLEPPQKIHASGYKYCPHCCQLVSQRTYLNHASLAQVSGFTSASNDTSTENCDGVNDSSQSQEIMSEHGSDQDFVLHQDGDVHDHMEGEADKIYEDVSKSDLLEEDLVFYENIRHHNTNSEYSSSDNEFDDEDDDESSLPIPIGNNDNIQADSLLTWFVIFLSLWQSVFTISDKALETLLKFIKIFFTSLSSQAPLVPDICAKFPNSLHLLRKHANSQRDCFVKYVVCPSCHSTYPLETCFCINELDERVPKKCSHKHFPHHPHENRRLPCNAPLLKQVILTRGKCEYQPRYEYVYQPVKNSLQKLLNLPGFAAKLEHWRSRQTPDGTMSDVYDGNVWKDFLSEKYENFLATKRSIGVMLNVDFFQPYKHVQQSYGVIYMTIMNLPRAERFKQQNVLIIGIIPAFEHEPDCLNSFLRPLVEELKEFWNPGVRLYTAESSKFKLNFKIALMCVACDIPAARKCCGFKGHTANYGCSRCKKFFPGGFGERKDFSGFDRQTWTKRNLDDHKSVCKRLRQCTTNAAKESLQTQTGIKYSVLVDLPYFDPIRFTIIDPMHNLFLGTAKHVMKNLWIKKNIITDDHLDLIQARVNTYIAPSGIGRIPHKISSSYGGFTAEQWKNWVTLYSMFALRNILPQQHYKCWQSFVLACFYLCRRSITHNDSRKADLLLMKFCEDVEQLYGKEAITPNMHLHGHLVECINDYGSIYGFWCFSFERYNGTLGNFPNNKRKIAAQMMKRFIYDCECYNQQVPEMFREQFSDMILFKETRSEIHQHDIHNHRLLTDCIAANLSPSFQAPCTYKTSVLAHDDYNNLKDTYSYLYHCNVTDGQMTRSIKIYKSIQLYGQLFSSVKNPQSRHSAHLMAEWSKSDGTIDTNNEMRPGKALHYISHSFKVRSTYVEHIFAVVAWLAEHPNKLYYGKPLEIWKRDYISDGPSMFLPIHKIYRRCIVCHGRLVPSETTHGISSSTEEVVMFVSPLPSLQNF